MICLPKTQSSAGVGIRIRLTPKTRYQNCGVAVSHSEFLQAIVVSPSRLRYPWFCRRDARTTRVLGWSLQSFDPNAIVWEAADENA